MLCLGRFEMPSTSSAYSKHSHVRSFDYSFLTFILLVTVIFTA